ncbi:hypothetical protein B0H65DRAFT_581479 [Neurospora tetraspora]|uniref:Uncharacterized protein n=1 Tax=Neurospora tetraspora TaxID=94610 RepID=A0AAE0J7K5_9PEZI|nr:hypothetical protein B0H65DRAFT_581479 [Neurospora tetraspora]
MKEVKVARYQDQIAELAEFVDSVLDHEDEDMPHEEELHVVKQKLSEVKTFLEDLRMDKARSASGHQSQQIVVVCKGCISQFITNPEQLREMGIEEGSEEEAEFAEFAEWLWKQVWEEEVGKSGYTSLHDVASDLNSFVSPFSEYLFLQDANHMLSIERLKSVTASQNGQATILPKSDMAYQNTNEAKRNAGDHLPTLRRWIDSLGRRLRRS